MTQLDRTTQKANIDSRLPDNIMGLVSPELHRSVSIDQADSAVFQDEFKDSDIKDKLENLTGDDRLMSSYVRNNALTFDGNLSSSDTDIQKAFETIDQLDIEGYNRIILPFNSLNAPYVQSRINGHVLHSYFEFSELDRFYISAVHIEVEASAGTLGFFPRLRESGTTTDYFENPGENITTGIQRVTLAPESAMPTTGSSFLELQVATTGGTSFIYSMTLELTKR